MSIFGKLDAATIPTNPYFVEKGEYEAEVTKAEYRNSTSKDGAAQRQLFIQYTITDENSQYLDSKVSQYFTLVDSEMTAEAFALLPSDEQKAIRRTLSALKRTLCGNEGNERQKGLGVNPDDLNDENWDPKAMVGTPVNIGVDNYGENGQGVNVRWVNLRD